MLNNGSGGVKAWLFPRARALTVAVLVSLAESGAEFRLVSVARAVRGCIPAVGVPVITMADGVIALAVTSVDEPEIPSGFIPLQACRVFVNT